MHAEGDHGVGSYIHSNLAVQLSDCRSDQADSQLSHPLEKRPVAESAMLAEEQATSDNYEHAAGGPLHAHGSGCWRLIPPVSGTSSGLTAGFASAAPRT